MFFFQGGGACFSAETCSFSGNTYETSAGIDDDPSRAGGVFDTTNPENPFADWSVVFVPYCTGDVHIGNATTDYGNGLTVQHKGYVNGTAEQTWSTGLLWVQAPWGYALSLVLGGLWFAPAMRRHGFTTLLDPFERRFGKNAAALLYIPALTGEDVTDGSGTATFRATIPAGATEGSGLGTAFVSTAEYGDASGRISITIVK
jgi:hypothetical protein